MLISADIPKYIFERGNKTPNYICLYYLKVNTSYKLLVNPHWSYSPVFYPQEVSHKWGFCNCGYLYEFIHISMPKTESFLNALILCKDREYRWFLRLIKNQTTDIVLKVIHNTERPTFHYIEDLNDEVVTAITIKKPLELTTLADKYITVNASIEYIKIIYKEINDKESYWLYQRMDLNKTIPNHVRDDKEFKRLAIDFGFLELLTKK